jgi:hypothetical protein
VPKRSPNQSQTAAQAAVEIATLVAKVGQATRKMPTAAVMGTRKPGTWRPKMMAKAPPARQPAFGCGQALRCEMNGCSLAPPYQSATPTTGDEIEIAGADYDHGDDAEPGDDPLQRGVGEATQVGHVYVTGHGERDTGFLKVE